MTAAPSDLLSRLRLATVLASADTSDRMRSIGKLCEQAADALAAAERKIAEKDGEIARLCEINAAISRTNKNNGDRARASERERDAEKARADEAERHRDSQKLAKQGWEKQALQQCARADRLQEALERWLLSDNPETRAGMREAFRLTAPAEESANG